MRLPTTQDVTNKQAFQKAFPRGKESRFPIPSTPRWILDIDYWILDIEQRLLDIGY
jgi:hypothetical protein